MKLINKSSLKFTAEDKAVILKDISSRNAFQNYTLHSIKLQLSIGIVSIIAQSKLCDVWVIYNN
jgi:hypothetical protein